MNKFATVVIGLLIGIVLGFFGGMQYQTSKQTAPVERATKTTTSNTGTQAESLAGSESMESHEATDEAEVKEIVITGSNFKFTPSEVRVKKGQKTKIIFKNEGGMHDFRVDELQLATAVLKDGEEEVIEFTPDKVGTFEYYCSVGKHREMGMVGSLIVE